MPQTSARPTLHLLGLPHTVTRPDFSHCAFTELVRTFGPMMRAEGYRVIHYGVAGAMPGEGVEHVQIMTEAHQLRLLGRDRHHQDPAKQFGDDTKADALYETFNRRAAAILSTATAPGDIVCVPFGHGHRQATHDMAPAKGPVHVIEITVGHETPYAAARIYPSQAWRHTIMAREGRSGVAFDSPRYERVIPHWIEPSEWEIVPRPGRYVLYFGRLTEFKGIELLPRLARACPSVEFIACGQGPVELVQSLGRGVPNLEYVPPVSGGARAALLGGARAVLCPTRCVEPFNVGAIQAMACGTPVIASDFGAFPETVTEGVTGFRCRTERQWIEAVDRVLDLPRMVVAATARSRFATRVVGPQYADAFGEMVEQATVANPFANDA